MNTKEERQDYMAKSKGGRSYSDLPTGISFLAKTSSVCSSLI